MTDRWARLEQIYHKAADLPATERDAFLSVACADDPVLRRDVDALLQHAETAFLEPAEPVSLTGSRIGAYDVREVIGHGGMGVVYHAVDTRLGRDVAIKVLPPAWSADSARRTRFEREARILASLNHPNIANVFDLETSSGIFALVMELVDGETLRERIAAGRLRPSEVITLGEQMAAGLEAAHEAGIVHRDFKPENVKITPDGLVKILDFGIATVQTGRWPELTSGITREGDVVGTANYMSPEQARGKTVDRRTDIWALGCVLFEMLTRSLAFTGNAWSDAVATVTDDEPDWNLLERFAPPGLARLIRRCLAKDPGERLRDAGDARLELRALAHEPVPAASLRVGRSPWMLIAVAVLAAVTSFVLGIMRGASAWRTASLDLALPLPPNVSHPPDGAQFAVAPDGHAVAFAGRDAAGTTRLFIQSLADRSAKVVRNSEGARYPFFSRDGKWLAFFANGQLKKLTVPDGPVQPLCRSDIVPRDPEWAADAIVFADMGDARRGGLRRLPADCGEVAIVTQPDRNAGETRHFFPQVLDGGAILFTTRRDTDAGLTYRIMVVPASGQAARLLIDDALRARYIGGGVLLYQRGGSLFSTTVDTTKWTIGPSRLVVEDVEARAPAPWAVAANTLVYQPNAGAQRTLSWVTREGVEDVVRAPARRYYAPALSPSLDLVAMEVEEAASVDVWTYDFKRELLRRVTFDGLSRYPEWTPDGSRITIARRRAGTLDFYSLPPDATSGPDLLKRNERIAFVASWTRDLQTMIYSQSTERGSDVWTYDQQRRIARPLLQSAATIYAPRLSPDQRWLAYVSNSGGSFEIYVTSYPSLTGHWQLTSNGAREPIWSADGRELFYRSGDQVFAIPIESTQPFTAGRPVALFRGPYFQPIGPGIRSYGVSSDGRRFLMMREIGDSAPMLRIISNFSPTPQP
jgi:Tol biopolymer transport system component/predicted Ser/Thr protein kinase